MTAKRDFRPHFDVAAMDASNVEPTIRIGRFVYVGRLLSAVEWFEWNERLQRLKERSEGGKVTGQELLAFYHAYFRAVFPPGLFRRGVPFWAPDVADMLIQEPLATIEEAFARFFARQALANGVKVETRTESPSMNGTSSSSSTRAAATICDEGGG